MRQRTFAIIDFGEYPGGSDPSTLDDERFADLVNAAPGASVTILDQKGVGEWIAEAIEKGLAP